MALGAQNRQVMAPAQFVVPVREGQLVNPGNYSSPNFRPNVEAVEYARMIQDAMQKQAAFEAAYQERQNNMGWDLVDRVQSTLDKGVQTSNRFENMKAQALANQLTEQFGAEDRRLAQDSVRAQTRQTGIAADQAEFDFGLKKKYGEEEVRTELERKKAQTEGTRQDTRGKIRENEILDKYGERKTEADIKSTELGNQTAANTLTQAILDREKRQALFGIATDESRRIHKLYESAMIGEPAAYDRLFDYAIPADLLEDPKLMASLQEQLDEARRNAANSKTIELSKKSRIGYQEFANKLYTDGPRGQVMAARVVGILNQTPGFLTSEQTEAIVNAYELYRTQINPGTQVKLPEIVDTLEKRQAAREADRQTSVRQPPPPSTVNQIIRMASGILSDMASTPEDKDLALGILRTQAGRDPSILDPRIAAQIELQRLKPGTETDKPNARTQAEEDQRTYSPGQ